MATFPRSSTRCHYVTVFPSATDIAVHCLLCPHYSFILYASCAGQDHHKVLHVLCAITFMGVVHLGSKQATKANALA
jgi:hypothetical protein